MNATNKTSITVQATIESSVEKVWTLWTAPEHIMQWNNASDDWHTPHAENDIRPGGKFKFTMAAKDGSFRFDFGGTYSAVTLYHLIAYTIEDGRTVTIRFEQHGKQTSITETFEAENENPEELQRQGWQAILNNFKRYAEEIK